MLTEERERNTAQAENLAAHQDLMSKVEKLHLLEDSNRLLRDENTQLAGKVAELEARAKQLQVDIEPLRQQKEQ
jgi:outer membrane murein-binding lipoprotein Lpp